MRAGVKAAVAHLLNRNRPDEIMILLGRSQHQKIVENGGNVGPGRRDLPAGQFARLPCRHCGDAERAQPCGEDGEELHEPGAVERRPLESRSEEHTSELQSLMRISYAVFCLKTKTSTTSLLLTKQNKPQQLKTNKQHHISSATPTPQANSQQQ